MKCQTCPRHCELAPNQTGFCGARQNQNEKIVPINYGLATALNLDPIEKKPLVMFFPGAKILSVGSFGCNLVCPFCQNYSISKEFVSAKRGAEFIPPEELVQKALALKEAGNIGIAFTYNEPLVAWEYVRDAASLAHEHGLKNVIVTNGCVLPNVLEEILPYTDAMNIDLKAFNSVAYKKLGGDFETVKTAIELCAAQTHIELTTLIVPGFNDSADEMQKEAGWISSTIGKATPLHITRFFPCYKMYGSEPTPLNTIHSLAQIARKKLTNVFTGNC